MTDFFRIWFIVVYILGFLYFLGAIFSFRWRQLAVEQKAGPLPSPPAIISWLIPPFVLLAQFAQIPLDWIPIRIIGVCLSLYAMIMMPWATWMLGQSYTPGPALLENHVLITAGPFRLVRHPIYSAVAALWLGVVLGTMNWFLLLILPGLLIALNKTARKEEKMLSEKFGSAYDLYAKQKGRLIPGFTGRRKNNNLN